jgi:glutathione synthase/RimK-type ligase-like ATP-grasp enzyme
MKKILIFNAVLSKKNQWELEYFKNYFNNKNFKVESYLYKDLVIYLESGELKVYFKEKELDLNKREVAFVYFRRRGGNSLETLSISTSMAYIVKKRGISFFDRDLAMGFCINKRNQMVLLGMNDIPIPRTFLIGEVEQVDRNFILGKIKLPWIVKPPGGSEGKGIFLITKLSDLDKINLKGRIMIQDFIPNEGDYRLLVTDGRVTFIENRVRKDEKEFRNNVCLGADEVIVDIDKAPEEMIALAEKSAKIFDRQIAGVDVLFDEADGCYKVLEVNPSPGFSKPNVTDEIKVVAEAIMNKVSQEERK